jgi:hypothetical protein
MPKPSELLPLGTFAPTARLGEAGGLRARCGAAGRARHVRTGLGAAPRTDAAAGTTAPGECSGFLRLRSKIQQYDWGVVGKGSLVGQLGRAGGALARIDDYDPYAELWVGIHPNGPSTLYVEDGQGRSLADHLRDFPQQLSSDPAEQAAGLSFLLKLLSVGKVRA